MRTHLSFAAIFLASACAPDTTPPPAEIESLFQEVAIFQAVRVPHFEGNADVGAAERTAPIIANREGILRAKFDLPADFTPRALSLEVNIDGETFSASREVDAASTADDPESGLVVELPARAFSADAQIAVRLLDDATVLAELPTRALAAFETGPLRVRFVPYEVDGFVPDTTSDVIAGLREALYATFPVSEVEVSVDEVQVWTDEFDMGAINVDVGARQEAAMVNGEVSWDTYFYAMATGVATRDEFDGITGTSEDGGDGQLVKAYFAAGAAFGDQRAEDTLIHEIGHTHRLLHTDCDGESNTDDDYPYDGGSIGVEGYDLRTGTFVSADTKSMMAYCTPRWVSDYSFGKLADHVAAAQLYAGFN